MQYDNLTLPRSVEGRPWTKRSPRALLQYAVGALMYTPGDHPTIGADISAGRYPQLKSVCLCLEDAVLDSRLTQAEAMLVDSFRTIATALDEGTVAADELPLLFIRPRSPAQMRDIFGRLGGCAALLCGFVPPKFDGAVCEGWAQAAAQVNAAASEPVYILPILESAPLLYPDTRAGELAMIRRTLDGMRERVLGVRVGGNDLCNLLAVRRRVDQTIYDNAVLAGLLGDIVLALGADYALSAPVWEYFGAPDELPWQEGLRRELRLDLLNGFVGKTAIHPSQLEPIQAGLVVDAADYADALAVTRMQGEAAVAKGAVSMRMNEERVHNRWAERVLALAEVFGVREAAR